MVVSRRALLGTAAAGVLAGCAPPDATPSAGPVPSSALSGAPATISASSPAAPLRIAAASDLHYGQNDTDYDRFADELVERLNAAHAKAPLDLVVLNGDLAHGSQHLAPLRRRLAGLKPPLVTVQGNHDRASEQQWRELWGHGFNHSRTVKGVRIACAATSDQAGQLLCADPAWLESALEAANGAPVIVALHITPVTWTRWGIDCPATTGLLARYRNVVAVLNGHDHDQFGVKTRDGVPYLFDSHAGGHWGTDFRGFRLLELHADGRIETRVTDGTTVFGSHSLPPRS